MKRSMTLSLVMLTVFALTGCGGGGGGGGSTPDATFEGMKAAAVKKDWGGFFGGLTADSQDMMIGALSMSSAMPVPGMDAEKMKGLSDLMTKHGVKPVGLPELMATGGDQAKTMELMKKVGGDVKNKAACIGDAMAWMDKNMKDNPMSKELKPEEIAASKLENVKIDGDKATASIKNKDGKEEPVEFKKVGGKWYMDMMSKMK